ncbi:MAG: SGNH/GDSL hydrolase family protein, partial [Verrucomicrobiota bacterium]
VGLRVFFPRYRYVADSDQVRNALRIMARKPDTRTERKHPDSGRRHPVIYNRHGLRRNREVDDGAEVRIGVFGDSFTENVNLDAPHMFTELLDFLLNAFSGPRCDVLNLGVEGYGTDQALLYFREWSANQPPLDHVFYVLCRNDLLNIHENQLFGLDPSGALRRNPAPASNPWVRMAGRLHLTYLVMDVALRLSGKQERSVDAVFTAARNRGLLEARRERSSGKAAEALRSELRAMQRDGDSGEAETLAPVLIFQALLAAWREAVEEEGGRFHVVVLPHLREHRLRALIDDSYSVVDLYAAFQDEIEGYRYAEHVRLRNDTHWNERGNLLAAKTLYRFLEPRFGRVRSDAELGHQIGVYYASVAGGWLPEPSWIAPADPGSEEAARIRARYRGLE